MFLVFEIGWVVLELCSPNMMMMIRECAALDCRSQSWLASRSINDLAQERLGIGAFEMSVNEVVQVTIWQDYRYSYM